MTIKTYNDAVDLYADNLYRFVVKHIKNSEKAKDILQDTFEKLWGKRNDVHPDKVKSYLFATAYHTLIDVVRKDKKQNYIAEVKPENFEVNNQYSDLNEILHQAIDRLPADQKSVILLRDYEGYSYEEIAEITHLTISQVKVYIFRGRKFLKNYLGSVESLI